MRTRRCTPRSLSSMPYAFLPRMKNVIERSPASSPGHLLDDVRLEAVILGPAQVHAAEHLRPVGGVGSAGAGANRDDRAVRVVRAVEVRRHLELVERLAARAIFASASASAPGSSPSTSRISARRRARPDGVDRLEVRAQVGDPLHDAARALGVAPELVGARARLELGYACGACPRRQSRTLSALRRSRARSMAVSWASDTARPGGWSSAAVCCPRRALGPQPSARRIRATASPSSAALCPC